MEAGHGRGRSPVEWGEIPSFCPSVRPPQGQVVSSGEGLGTKSGIAFSITSTPVVQILYWFSAIVNSAGQTIGKSAVKYYGIRGVWRLRPIYQLRHINVVF